MPESNRCWAACPHGVEAVRRVGAQASYLFVINHTDGDVTVPAPGTDLLGGPAGLVRAGAVAVIREG